MSNRSLLVGGFVVAAKSRRLYGGEKWGPIPIFRPRFAPAPRHAAILRAAFSNCACQGFYFSSVLEASSASPTVLRSIPATPTGPSLPLTRRRRAPPVASCHKVASLICVAGHPGGWGVGGTTWRRAPRGRRRQALPVIRSAYFISDPAISRSVRRVPLAEMVPALLASIAFRPTVGRCCPECTPR